MSEMDLVNQIIDYVTMTGGVAIRINAGVIFVDDGKGKRVFRGAPKGTSDILACIRGRYYAIECKWGDNTATPEQIDFIERVRAAGGVGGVVWTFDEFLQLVKGAQNERA